MSRCLAEEAVVVKTSRSASPVTYLLSEAVPSREGEVRGTWAVNSETLDLDPVRQEERTEVEIFVCERVQKAEIEKVVTSYKPPVVPARRPSQAGAATTTSYV